MMEEPDCSRILRANQRTAIDSDSNAFLSTSFTEHGVFCFAKKLKMDDYEVVSCRF